MTLVTLVGMGQEDWSMEDLSLGLIPDVLRMHTFLPTLGVAATKRASVAAAQRKGLAGAGRRSMPSSHDMI